MFAKTALVATIAVAAQALTAVPGFTRCAGENGICKCTGEVIYGNTGHSATKIAKKESTGSIKCNNATFGDPLGGVVKECLCKEAPKPAPVPVATSTFADDEFLMGGLDSFADAEAARQKYVVEHAKRNLARRQAAHVYFNAKDVAAEKVRIEGEFNVAWLKAVTAHDDAILAHSNAKESTIAAANSKRLAILAHLQATEAANATDALRLHALAAWNASKVATAEAREDHSAALSAKAAADAEANRTASVLATKEGEEAAAKVEHNIRDSDNNAALATKADALATENAAKARHTAAEQAQARANTAETNAARARASAFASHKDAVEKTRLAIAEKAAALARARAASNEVRTHMQANWMYAL